MCHTKTYVIIGISKYGNYLHIVFNLLNICFIIKYIFQCWQDIKIAALECLRQYASYPTILINPYKQIVLNELKKAIGDRKRLVRKAAVEARLQWFMVGASRGSKE